MTDIKTAIEHLGTKGIEAFEGSNILIIPCTSPEQIYDLASKVRRIFKEIDFQKSWQIDPYFYDKKRHADGSVVVGPEDYI